MIVSEYKQRKCLLNSQIELLIIDDFWPFIPLCEFIHPQILPHKVLDWIFVTLQELKLRFRLWFHRCFNNKRRQNRFFFFLWAGTFFVGFCCYGLRLLFSSLFLNFFGRLWLLNTRLRLYDWIILFLLDFSILFGRGWGFLGWSGGWRRGCCLFRCCCCFLRRHVYL